MSYGTDNHFSSRCSHAEWLREAYELKLVSKIIHEEFISSKPDRRCLNYDKEIHTKDGRVLFIEEKFRRGPTRDLLVETHHEYDDGTVNGGWIHRSKADILSYVAVTISPTDNDNPIGLIGLQLINMLKLRELIQSAEFEKLDAAGRIEHPKPSRNDGYYTYNVGISWMIVDEYKLMYENNLKKMANKRLDWFQGMKRHKDSI